MRTDVIELSPEAGPQKIAAEAAAKSRLDVPGFGDQHERGAGDFLHHVRVDDIQGGLVDDPNRNAPVLKPHHRIERTIDGLPHGDHVAAARRRLTDHIVLAWFEGFGLVQRLSGGIENIRNRRARAENESEAGVAEYALYACRELMLIDREIKPGQIVRVAGLDASVGNHAVDAEMKGIVGHVIDAAVAEVRQHVREIETRHRDLADAHFEERAEGGVDTLPARR